MERKVGKGFKDVMSVINSPSVSCHLNKGSYFIPGSVSSVSVTKVTAALKFTFIRRSLKLNNN